MGIEPVVKNIPVVLMSQATCGYSKSHKLSTAQWPHYGFNDYSGCNDIKPLEIFLTTSNFWLDTILPHSRTSRGMNFIFTTKQVEVFVHMIFKFALLSQTDWEMVNFFDFKRQF